MDVDPPAADPTVPPSPNPTPASGPETSPTEDAPGDVPDEDDEGDEVTRNITAQQKLLELAANDARIEVGNPRAVAAMAGHLYRARWIVGRADELILSMPDGDEALFPVSRMRVAEICYDLIVEVIETRFGQVEGVDDMDVSVYFKRKARAVVDVVRPVLMKVFRTTAHEMETKRQYERSIMYYNLAMELVQMFEYVPIQAQLAPLLRMFQGDAAAAALTAHLQSSGFPLGPLSQKREERRLARKKVRVPRE